MCKCSTATTGANQQNMGVAGPRLQGLYGRPKRGVRPNESLIAHSSAADERFRKAINHTCWHQPGTEIKCQKPSVLLAPLLEDPRVIHPNNVRELDLWSKMVVIHEDHTIDIQALCTCRRQPYWSLDEKEKGTNGKSEHGGFGHTILTRSIFTCERTR
jgi:hypothetical protein